MVSVCVSRSVQPDVNTVVNVCVYLGRFSSVCVNVGRFSGTLGEDTYVQRA